MPQRTEFLCDQVLGLMNGKASTCTLPISGS